MSFSLGLVDTIQKANKFLKKVQDAPKELARLVDALDLLESHLIAAAGIIEQQNKIGSLPGSVHLIDRSLQCCKSTVEKLKTSVDTLEAYSNRQGRGRKIWGSLKIVVREEDMDRLHDQVQTDMRNLQAALSFNMSYLQLHQFGLNSLCLLPSNISTQHDNLTAVTTLRSGSEWKDSSAAFNDSIVKSQTENIWQHWGFFGITRFQKKTKFLRNYSDTPEEVIDQENCLLFTPSFLRTGFELRFNGGCLQLPRNLTYFPILPFYAKEFELCEPQNMESFKKALSRRESSPFVRDEYGRTLLHYASELNHAELCSLLVQVGVDPDYTTVSGTKALHYIRRNLGCVIDTMRVLARAQGDLSSDDLVETLGYDFRGSPESADFLLSAYGSPNLIEWGDSYGCSLSHTALYMYGLGKSEWEPWIRKWLLNEPDIHSRLSSPTNANPDRTFTHLDELFGWIDDPIQARSYGEKWLLMLAEADYDVNAYLEKEKQFRSIQEFLVLGRFHRHMPRRLVFEVGENPKIYWDWWIDASSPASLVHHEFWHISVAGYDYYYRDCTLWEKVWPYDYLYSLEDFNPDYAFLGKELGYPKSLEQWKERAKQAAIRYARRAKKKNRAKSKKPNTEYPAIPGAWIEEEF